jgi:hypothetical protein
VEKAVGQRADELIPNDARLAVAERRALALVAICQGSLYDKEPDSRSAPVEVAVAVDARTAAPANGNRSVSPGRAPDRTRHVRRGLLQWDRRGGRHRRERRAAQLGAPVTDRATQATTIRPRAGRGMHRRRLYQPVPARGPPRPAVVLRRRDQRRRSDHALGTTITSPSTAKDSTSCPSEPLGYG